MRRSPGPSPRPRRLASFLLVGALLASVVPVLAVFSINALLLRSSLERSLVGRGRRLAASVADSASAFLGPAVSSVKELAVLAPEAAPGELLRAARLKRRFSPYFRAFHVVDSSDRVIISLPETPSMALLPVGDLEWVREPRSSGLAYVSDSFISNSTGRASATISFASPSGGTVVAAELDLSVLAEYVGDSAPGDPEVLILDRRGVVVAARDSRLVEERVNRLPLIAAAIPADGLEYEDDAGLSRVGFGATVPSSPWTVFVAFPRGELMEPLDRFLRAAALAGGLLLLGLGGASAFASRRLLAAFAGLRRLVGSIGEGHPRGSSPEELDFAEFRDLAAEVEELGRRIGEREASLRETIGQRDTLLREVHHRVKNNMQIISSLVSLQRSALTDEAAIAALTDSSRRIHALSLVHERIYRSTDFSGLDLGEYVEELCEALVAAAGDARAAFVMRREPLTVTPDLAIPVGLCVNEIVSNSLKYAFPGRRDGTIEASVRREGGRVLLELSDDGVGFDPGADRGSSIGMSLIEALAAQVGASLELDAGRGTRYRLLIPAPPAEAAPLPPASPIG